MSNHQKTLEELGIKVKKSSSHGLAGPTIFQESNVYSSNLFFDLGNLSFEKIYSDPSIIEIINKEVPIDYINEEGEHVRPREQFLSLISAQELDWQLVFVNSDRYNKFLYNKIIEEWEILRQMLPYTRTEDSFISDMKSILINTSKSEGWNYLLNKEKISEPICSFLFPSLYLNRDRIFTSSLGIGNGFMKAKIWQKAVQEFERAIGNWPETEKEKSFFPHIISALGGCYENLGEVDKAIEVLEDLVNKKTTIPLTHYNLGWAYDEKGRKTKDLSWFVKSAQEYERAIELDSSYYDAYYNLACAYALARKDEEAIFSVRKAHEKGLRIGDELRNDRDFYRLIDRLDKLD